MRSALRLQGEGEHLPALLFAGQSDGFIILAESAPIVAGLEAGSSLTVRGPSRAFHGGDETSSTMLRFSLEAKNVARASEPENYQLRKATELCKGNQRQKVLVKVRRLRRLGTPISSVPTRRILQQMLKVSGRPVSVAARDWTIILHPKVPSRRGDLRVFEIDDTSCGKMQSEAL